jgi:hypothetical protein
LSCANASGDAPSIKQHTNAITLLMVVSSLRLITARSYGRLTPYSTVVQRLSDHRG